MYAIVQAGSSQLKVMEGDIVAVDLFQETQDKEVTLDKVLMYENGSDVRVGQPYLKEVTVKAEIVDPQKNGPKTVAFKYRRTKDSKRKVGHRQKYTMLKIKKISA